MASNAIINLACKNSSVSLLNARLQKVGAPRATANLIQKYLGGASASIHPSSLAVQVLNGDGVKASGTVTFTGQAVAADTVTLNGVAFTAVASGATGNEFNIGSTTTITATNLAAAINASTSAKVAGVLSASSATDVVTVSCQTSGTIGNLCTMATSDSTNITLSGAALTGGVNDTASVNTYHLGL